MRFDQSVTTVCVQPLECRRLLSAGDLDPTFGIGGRASTPSGSSTAFHDSVVLANDKVLMGGSTPLGEGGAYILRRFNADGSLDGSFGTAGTVTGYFGDNRDAGSSIHEMLVQPNGKIVLRGDAWGGALARFNADGTLDTSFDGDGVIQRFSKAIGVAPDGKVIAAADYVGASQRTMTRYNVDGSLDATFGTNGTANISGFGEAEVIRVLPDNRILVGTRGAVARFNADGSFDTTFGNAGVATMPVGGIFRDLALLPGGKLLAAGNDDGAFFAVRFNADGSVDNTFAGGHARVQMGEFLFFDSIVIDNDGNAILIGDSFHGLALTRITPAGQIDGTFGRISTDSASSVFVRGGGIGSDGNIIVAGAQNTSNPGPGFSSETFIYRVLAEDNGVPTPVTLDSTSRKLSVPGTSGNDLIRLYEERNVLRAYRNGFGRAFDVEDVDSIALSGRAGDDVVQVMTSTVPAHVTGGDGADRITGGDAEDTLQGNLGPDRIDGNGGADTIDAGAGNDAVRGGDGDDTLTGGHGDDELRGNVGADTYDMAGAGDNFIIDIDIRNLSFTRSTGLLKYFDTTNTDDDVLVFPDGSGGLSVSAGGETDTIPIGVITKIELNGNGGDDRLRLDPSLAIPALLYGGIGPQLGPGGDDTLVGGAGNDTLIGHGDEDVLEGGAGNDQFVAADGFADVIRGGPGSDSAEIDEEDDVLDVETT